MNDEQIKQNAEAYADKAAPITEQNKGIPLAIHTAAEVAYIAGAHSRDEEIEELKKEIESLQEQYNTCFDGFKKRGTKLGELMKENVKLRNPWISVEERLPEEHQDVLIENWNGLVIRNDYISIGDINYMKDNPELFPRWMPTPKPELKKGE